MVWASCDTSTSSDSTIWVTWTSTVGISSTASTSDCWTDWNNPSYDISATTATSSSTTWRVWVDGEEQHNSQATLIYQRRKQTHAEKQAEKDRLLRLAEERKEREARAKALEKEKKDAEKRAKDLLLDLIGEKELEVYNKTGRLFVKGKKFDYVVQKRGFIQRLEKKKITDLCVHLNNKYKFPETDNVVAMKLLIEHEEDRMLELANNHGSKTRPKELKKAACM